MCPDAIWQAFAQTGDPLYYLLYKSIEPRDVNDKPGKGREKDTQGDIPCVAD